MSHSIAMDMDGHPAELICPDQPAPGLPFVFRTAFFHAFDDADRALLARGFHLAYCDRPDEYGRPQAIAAYHCFHRRLCAEYGLSRRAALPIVSDATRLRGDACFEAEQRFTDLWALGEPDSGARRAGQELTRPFVRVEA